jgi:hypothetical protein
VSVVASPYRLAVRSHCRAGVAFVAVVPPPASAPIARNRTSVRIDSLVATKAPRRHR